MATFDPSPSGFFVTGTDTGVGKTYVSALLVRALRAAGHRAVGLKPICCGDRADAEILHTAAEGAISLDDVNPVWFRFPGSPYTAAIVENRQPDLDQIRDRFSRLRADGLTCIVEGIGGWRVPIRRDYFVSDFAAEFGLPVLVIAANRLGVLNHTLLTVESIRRSGLSCAGVILNSLHSQEDDPSTSTNLAVLEDLLGFSVLCEVTAGQASMEVPSGWLS